MRLPSIVNHFAAEFFSLFQFFLAKSLCGHKVSEMCNTGRNDTFGLSFASRIFRLPTSSLCDDWSVMVLVKLRPRFNPDLRIPRRADVRSILLSQSLSQLNVLTELRTLPAAWLMIGSALYEAGKALYIS